MFHSSQEGVTGTRDIPSHEKSKSEQNIWNIVFQYTEDLSTVIPRWRKKKKINKVSLTITSAYFP